MWGEEPPPRANAAGDAIGHVVCELAGSAPRMWVFIYSRKHPRKEGSSGLGLWVKGTDSRGDQGGQ